MLTATSAGTSSIDLSWTVPEDNGTPITGYEMQRWNSEGQPPAWDEETNLLTGRAANSPTVFTDDTLDAGTTYYYRIRATTGGAAAGAWSAEDTQDATSATTDGDAAGAPGVPLNFTAAQSTVDDEEDIVVVMWAEPGDAADANITGYKVQRWNSATGLWDEVATPTASPYNDSVTRGRTYYYRVAAVNAHGTGDYTVFDDAEVSGASTANPPQMVTATALGPDSNPAHPGTSQLPTARRPSTRLRTLEIWQFAELTTNSATDADWGG